MPELPEVETVKRMLQKVLNHQKIKEVIVRYRPIVSHNNHFEHILKSQVIEGFDRKGKYLVFLLTDHAVVSHLRMEGKYEYRPSNDKFTKHEHVIFRFENGYDLVYQDTRKFGRFEIKDKLNYLDELPLSKVAPEPFYMNPDDFYQSLKKRSISIKDALLDQHIIAGIGNIYANEVLFRAKVHPGTKSWHISYEKAKEILNASVDVLNQAIIEGGTTIDTFEVAPGIHGRFQHYLKVHGKKNVPCSICQTPIIKYQLSGRGTYFCPSCQRPYLIGLTGGIASGKTTVSTYLKEKGYLVIDTDKIVHDLYKDPKHVRRISNMFGIPYYHGDMDKKALSNLVFKDSKAREKLNQYLHPLVFEQVELIKHQSVEPVIFIDVPLLFETGYQTQVDLVLVVYSKESTQMERLINRNGLTSDEARLRVKSQMPLIDKKALSDVWIDNESTIAALYEKVDAFLKERKI